MKSFYFLFLLGSIDCDFLSINVDQYNISSYCNQKEGNITLYNHTNFEYRIKEPNLCSGRVYLLNYVQSSSDHFDRRMLIRETFGSLKFIDNDPVKLVFVVGIPRDKNIQKLIDIESENFRDLVQADFVDSYRNLTLKHIVALHWVHHFCPQAQFISKSDDDTFVNNIWLRLYLKENKFLNEAFILGLVSFNEKPIRRPGIKWTVDREMYESEFYPAFIKGSGYVLSQAAIEPLLVCSYYQRYFYIDDIFVTGLVRSSAHVSLKYFDHIYLFTYFINETINTDVLSNAFVVGNNVISQHMWKEVWKTVLLMIY